MEWEFMVSGGLGWDKFMYWDELFPLELFWQIKVNLEVAERLFSVNWDSLGSIETNWSRLKLTSVD